MNAHVQTKKDSIRVDTGVKYIEVNDEGECIALNFADQSFGTRFFNLIDDFQAKEAEFRIEAEEIDHDHTLSEMDRTRREVELNQKIHEYFKAQIDTLFGQDTCRKVFGDIVPAIDLYADFFEKIKPYMIKYGKERAKKASKYSAARRGNV